RIPALPPNWALIVGVLAVAGAEALLLRMLLSLLASAVFTRGAARVEDERLRRAFAAARDQIGLSREVGLRITPRIAVPVVAGLAHPSLLLPVEARGWDADRLNVVFLHELAHVRRGDSACLLVARAA